MIKFFTCFLLVAFLGHSAQAAYRLKIGDVLLQPLKCWACTLIEEEEETIYSHIGVVVALGPEVLVAEAFGTVRKITLAEFDKKTEPGQELMVLRFRRDDLVEDLQQMSSRVLETFVSEFEGARYDHDFRWNNFDELGREKFYCSELVTKMFQRLVGVEVGVKRMHFERNRDRWMTYFRGNIPDGQWGNSPGDFHRSELFYEVGEL